VICSAEPIAHTTRELLRFAWRSCINGPAIKFSLVPNRVENGKAFRFRRKWKQRAKKKQKWYFVEKKRKQNILNGNRRENGGAVSDENRNGKKILEKQIRKLSKNISTLGPCKEALHLHDKTRPC
jgi:hypothetical protein